MTRPEIPDRLLALALALTPLACGETCKRSPSDIASARFARPSPSDFWNHPWPSNARLTHEGTISLLGFPNPTESTTLAEYLAAIQKHARGFAMNAAAYLPFSGPLDPRTLPRSLEDATREDASLFLVDVDASSPERGRRYPLEARFADRATTYLPANIVSLLPPFGIPLRSGTTYAVVGTSALLATDGSEVEQSPELHDALFDECAGQGDSTLEAVLAPLRAWLDEGDHARDQVRAASVFTTQDVIAEMRALADAARAEPTPTLEALTFDLTEKRFDLWTGEIAMPAFQTGRPPYAGPDDGGAIEFDAASIPHVTHHERVRVSVSVPEGTMPDAGWPAVLYAHGTYGDFRSVVSEELALALTSLGIVVVSYDQTLHGPRDPTSSDPGINFFNLANIVAGRDNVRQGGVDGVVMTKLMKELRIEYPGGEVRCDPDRIVFVGHSQGGISGAPLIAIEPSIRAAVFSGTAGILSITVEERVDPVSFLGLLRTLLGLPATEDVDDHHVLLSIIQTFIEPGDPINFARTYLSDPPGGSARDVLFIEGFKDSASPARGHEALSVAARAPVIAPVHRIPFAATLVGPAPQTAPAEGNVEGPYGRVTMGLIQYPDQDHWPMFDDPDAHAKALEFVRSALFDGRARIGG
ncbi:MAG: hypothetical protein HYV07_30320 [Deltaproteobacteria bacterium]|nr:hypothetical protein [Deltaproteobacteria bacterium]